MHLGYYPDPKKMATTSWQQAQQDSVDKILELAGLTGPQQQQDVCNRDQARKGELDFKLVDLGCGYGGTAVHIAKRLGCNAVGVNISPFQVQAANAYARRSGFSPKAVHFVVGDALAPPLPSASFDVVLSYESACYMPDKEKFVQQLARLCKPGGTVILCDVMRKAGQMTPQLSKRFKDMDAIFETASPWASSEEYRRMMVAQGLQIVSDTRWASANLRGFWRVGTLELLLRKDPGVTYLQNLVPGIRRALKVIWLLLTGGAKVWHMTATTLSGAMGSVVQTGLDCGDIEYHAIIAKKP